MVISYHCSLIWYQVNMWCNSVDLELLYWWPFSGFSCHKQGQGRLARAWIELCNTINYNITWVILWVLCSMYALCKCQSLIWDMDYLASLWIMFFRICSEEDSHRLGRDSDRQRYRRTHNGGHLGQDKQEGPRFRAAWPSWGMLSHVHGEWIRVRCRWVTTNIQGRLAQLNGLGQL